MVGKVVLCMIGNVFASSNNFLDKHFFETSKVLNQRFVGGDEKRDEQIAHQKACSSFIEKLLKRYNDIEKRDLYDRKDLLKRHQRAIQDIQTLNEYNRLPA